MSDNTSTITKKGQITIPSKYRKKYNLKQGGKVTFVETKNGLLIKESIIEVNKLRGLLRHTNLDEIAESEIKKIREEWTLDE